MSEYVNVMRAVLQRFYDYTALWFGLITLGAGSFVWTLFAIPLYYILPRQVSKRLGRWVIGNGFYYYLQLLSWYGACRFNFALLDTLKTQGPLIIAPNHPCLLDALMILSRLPNLVCIMKSSIIDNVFFGAGARMAGYICSDPQLGMIKQAIVELKYGNSLLIFPEGTRTTRWPINSCQGMVALIAEQAKVPIQTLLIETDSGYLTKGWKLFKTPTVPITYNIRLGYRFDPPTDVKIATMELDRYFLAELYNAQD